MRSAHVIAAEAFGQSAGWVNARAYLSLPILSVALDHRELAVGEDWLDVAAVGAVIEHHWIPRGAVAAGGKISVGSVHLPEGRSARGNSSVEWRDFLLHRIEVPSKLAGNDER